MSRVRIARIAACLCGPCLVSAVAVAPPAHADRYTKSDLAGDMRVVVHHKVSAAPAHRDLDLRSVLVRHVHHAVMIRAVMSELTKPRTDHIYLDGFVVVDRRARPSEGGRAWTWHVEFNRHHRLRGTRIYVTDARTGEDEGCQTPYNPRLRAQANYARDRVTVYIPRHCLARQRTLRSIDRPRWVRVSVETENTRARRSYFDYLGNPQPRGILPTLRRSYLTPRLRAG